MILLKIGLIILSITVFVKIFITTYKNVKKESLEDEVLSKKEEMDDTVQIAKVLDEDQIEAYKEAKDKIDSLGGENEQETFG